MVKPVILLIRRKTRVPTQNQIRHQYRSDWIKVGKVSYEDSIGIFNAISGVGPIIHEAQFAKLMYDNYGPGIYHINAWRKGTKGIMTFYYVELKHEGFMRIKKNQTAEEKEKQENKKELRHLNKQIADTAGSEREGIQQDIDDLKEELGFDAELISLMKTPKVTSQYIKAAKPVFKMHSYEDFGVDSVNPRNNIVEAKEIDSFY